MDTDNKLIKDKDIENKTDIDLLVETSWEVCNKVGGIYTVLSTKAKTLHSLYGDKVIFIGPDVWTRDNESPYFSESKSILRSWLKQLHLPDGVTVRVGRWLVPGRPIAILVGFEGMYARKNDFYGEMWQSFGVDSLHAYGDYDESCAFGLAAAMVIENLHAFRSAGRGTIAHFDEWTVGMGLLYLKKHVPEITTVFTTHATSIGRSICGNGKPLYDYLKGYDGDQMAAELNMQSKHSLEKAAAHAADCFTTVSDVTAIECEQLLGLRPDVVTPNGFEANFVPSRKKFVDARRNARRKLLSVGSVLCGSKLPDDTFIVATSGRCEYRNKGIDVYLDSIKALADSTVSRQVLAFVMVPAWSGDAREDVRRAIADSKDAVPIADGVVTHELHNYDSDIILSRIHGLGFYGQSVNGVQIVYVPCYLNGEDGVFDAPYYDLLVGTDATVFPSYYEPWGYTPMESVAFGVPTITTSLSGFGQWVLRESESGFENSGVTVLDRNDSNYSEVVDGVKNALCYLISADKAALDNIHKCAFFTAGNAAWSYFIRYYEEAYVKACAARDTRIAISNEIN